MTTDAEITAKLDKPGAGLPFPQELILRWYVAPFVAGRSDWEDDKKKFAKTTDALLKLAEGLDDKQLGTKVLVPPQQGLEDSSRYWSAAMVFEHLVIVGSAVKGGIVALSKGIVPPGKAGTAGVKPAGEATPALSVKEYRKFASTLMADLDRDVKDKDSKAKFTHPWLGPLNCRQWHWLLSAHQSIHLIQLREIVKGLGVKQ